MPPKKKPPAETVDKALIGLVKVPGVEEEIRNLTAVVANQRPPDGGGWDDDELISVIEGLSLAIRDQASVVQGNSEAIENLSKNIQAQTISIERSTTATGNLATATQNLADANNRIADILSAPLSGKASRVTISTTVGPLVRRGGRPMAEYDATTLPPIQCVPVQVKAHSEGYDTELVFNGKIDGEPTAIDQGGFSSITQDAKVESEVQPPTDPPTYETRVMVHGQATQPDDAVGGKGGLSVNWDADVEGTEQIEKFVQVFEDNVEWIAEGAVKANRVYLNTVARPL